MLTPAHDESNFLCLIGNNTYPCVIKHRLVFYDDMAGLYRYISVSGRTRDQTKPLRNVGERERGLLLKKRRLEN